MDSDLSIRADQIHTVKLRHGRAPLLWSEERIVNEYIVELTRITFILLRQNDNMKAKLLLIDICICSV